MKRSHRFNKIPIIVRFEPFWRVLIADNYENYKPSKYSEINFVDIGLHFQSKFSERTDDYAYNCCAAALEDARYVNNKYLNNKATITIVSSFEYKIK